MDAANYDYVIRFERGGTATTPGNIIASLDNKVKYQVLSRDEVTDVVKTSGGVHNGILWVANSRETQWAEANYDTGNLGGFAGDANGN